MKSKTGLPGITLRTSAFPEELLRKVAGPLIAALAGSGWRTQNQCSLHFGCGWRKYPDPLSWLRLTPIMRPSSRARGQLLPNSIYQKYYIGSGLRLRHTQNGLWAFRSSQPLPQLPSGELNLAVNQVVHAHPNCTPTVHGRATTKQVPAGSSSFCLVAFITAQVKLCLPWYPRWALPLPTMHVVYDRVLWI